MRLGNETHVRLPLLLSPVAINGGRVMRGFQSEISRFRSMQGLYGQLSPIGKLVQIFPDLSVFYRQPENRILPGSRNQADHSLRQ